ncbi:hypothetical protein ADK76_21815 [Streptomyces griseoflavus]|nr:hypothetical protein ADK76_21815 [Streptomyces griseoflavus]
MSLGPDPLSFLSFFLFAYAIVAPFSQSAPPPRPRNAVRARAWESASAIRSGVMPRSSSVRPEGVR